MRYNKMACFFYFQVSLALSCSTTFEQLSLFMLLTSSARSLHCVTGVVLLLAVPESQGGMFLVRQGEFHAGTHINVFFRIRCKTSAGLGSSQEMKIALADKRHITFFGW